VRRRLETWFEPEDAYLRLFAGSRRSFWLDSGMGATSGVSYVGDGHRLVTASVAEGTVTEWDSTVRRTSRSTVFDHLRANPDDTWVGWLGYELGALTNGTPWHPSRYSDAAMISVSRMLEFDHANRVVTAVEGPSTGSPEPFAWITGIERAPDRRSDAPPQHSRGPTGRAVWRHDRAGYRRLIEECQRLIRDGEAYQLCLTNQIRVDGGFDPVDVYLRLRRQSPSHHGGLIRCDGEALASASPELFLRIDADRTVTTMPIKGTRPRGLTADADDALRAALAASEKERAENLMIVDLMRNDIGRVAEVGTVTVPALLSVESYAQVHQLVSTVRGRMRAGVGAVDAIAACFPAGSMTGAPKISAISRLADLEAGPRGVYSGAFGMLRPDGTAELAMVIRSIVFDERGATIGTGGGITASSDPDEEIEETRLKARALLTALLGRDDDGMGVRPAG